MNNSPVKSELYVALEMVELTQFLPFTKKLNNGIMLPSYGNTCCKLGRITWLLSAYKDK